MTDPDVVVIHVSKGLKNKEGRGEEGSSSCKQQRWTKALPEMKPCSVRLNRLTEEFIASLTKARRREEKPLQMSEASATPEKPPEEPEVVEVVPDASPTKDSEEVVILPQAKPLFQVPAVPPVCSSAEYPFFCDPERLSKVLVNCLGQGSRDPNPSHSVFMSLVNNHRRECLKCDTQVVQRSPQSGHFLYSLSQSKGHQLRESQREARELRMTLKMSEEARAISDVVYERRLEACLEEIEELKRGIQFLLKKEDGGMHAADILKPRDQPILEQLKERKYYTSCGFNIINMTALREALLKAQACGHGNLTILENQEDSDYLAARLVFICQTCHAETLFFTSGFSEASSNFTVNTAVLKTLGEGTFFKLLDFVKQVPFKRPAHYVGPPIPDEASCSDLRDKVRLLLGVDKFDFEQWKDDKNSSIMNGSNEEDDDIIHVNPDEEGKDTLLRSVQLKDLEPEVELQEDIIEEALKPKDTPIMNGMKKDYLSGSPNVNREIFPELSGRIPFKITPRPMSELMAPPSKKAPPLPSLLPLSNSNNVNNSISQQSPPQVVLVPPATNTSPQLHPVLPITPVKIKPSKDLPPGSRILSIPPGTKVMCANICHSSPKETGLNPGVYRVIDSKNSEKVLIVENKDKRKKRRGAPTINIVSMKGTNNIGGGPLPRHMPPSPIYGGNKSNTSPPSSLLLPRIIRKGIPKANGNQALSPPKDQYVPNNRTTSGRIAMTQKLTITPETDPLANPTEDPLASTEDFHSNDTNGGRDEGGPLESPADPFLKIVNIFTNTKSSDEGGGNDVLEEPNEQEDPLSESNGGAKRMKIGT